jgi:hypothetical protein
MRELERLSLNLLKRDKDALRIIAAHEGEAMSVVVRRLIKREAREYGLLPPPEMTSYQGQQAGGQR